MQFLLRLYYEILQPRSVYIRKVITKFLLSHRLVTCSNKMQHKAKHASWFANVPFGVVIVMILMRRSLHTKANFEVIRPLRNPL